MFFGLVGAVGTDVGLISQLLDEVLRGLGYSSHILHVIELLKHVDSFNAELKERPIFERYNSRMDAGDEFRKRTERHDALALLAARDVQRIRKEHSSGDEPPPNTAYIFRSLKTPGEVETLRKIYGPGFFLIGSYAPKKVRREQLIRNIAGSTYSSRSAEVEGQADTLIYRDEKERRVFGQNVRDTFPMSDFFLDVTNNRESIRSQLDRFLSLIFGHPFLTPEPAETAMFHAQSAALRSAEMGRQVGAVLTTRQHSIISVGTNEVPKAGGGQYWPSDQDDRRTFQLDRDTSDELKLNNVAEVIDRLCDTEWLRPEIAKMDREDLMSKAAEVLRDTRIMSPIEFGRAVHAEMSAILDAAARGCPVQDTILYSTTFPCHNCTRHIIGAGVKRVVYIEPYAKSLTEVLHPEAVSVEGDEERPDRVEFTPYVGVAPRQYLSLFQMPKRKNPDGTVIRWNKLEAMPRLMSPPSSYVQNEDAWGALLHDVFLQTELEFAGAEEQT
jgi:deoxycytidylate deaminase